MAVVLDGAWIAAFVIAAREHIVAAAIGGVVLALGVLATRLRRLGHFMSLLRGFAAFVLIIAALVTMATLPFAVVAAASAVLGFAAAGAPTAAVQQPRAKRARSKRFDDVGSAVIHFAFLGLLILSLLAQRRFTTAAGFALWWIALMWGTIAVHEAGHAIAARLMGNTVAEVRIGVGLTLFRAGPISVGAIGFLGHTHWAPNETTMTSRREACIVLAGPGANLVVAFALLALSLARPDSFVVTLIASQIVTALLNLVPFQHGAHGQLGPSDGARVLRLLRVRAT